MSYTRAQLRTQIVRAMDATNSARWDLTAGGEVDTLCGHVFDREWRRHLSHQTFLRTAKRQPVADSSGRFLVSALAGGSADTTERLFRVLSVVLQNRVYQEVRYQDWILGSIVNQSAYVWYRNGDYLEVLPVPASGAQPDGIYINHIPQRPDRLSADGVTVTFPDGYEQILVYETAAMLLAKGGAEIDTSANFKALAEEMRQDMLQDLARFSNKPTSMQYADQASDWYG